MFPAVPYSRYIFGELPWYSVLIVTGILVAMALCIHEEKRRCLKPDTLLDLALWTVPAGILGARLYYVIFSWERFADEPIRVLYIWEGGLAVYGAVIAGLAAVLIFSKRQRLSPLLLTDIIAPGLVLAQGIGRWGNYFNMEAFGREITNPAWQFFPIGVQIPSGDSYVWHMATFFYESMWDIAIFALLWFVIRLRAKQHGTVTLWYLLLYGLGRFFIESLRTDSLMLGPIRFSQLLSGILVVLCAALLLIRTKQKETSTKES